MGALRPTILLPCEWRDWDEAKLDAVLAHEVSHVARRDALTQRLSLLHRAIFWFSPLAWWLDRHLADLAEQASDEAALAYGADRKDYARMLLGFFEALQTAPGRARWQGVSMAKAGQAEQRIERILSWKGSVAMQLKKSITVAVVAFAIPVVYLAASVHAASAHPQSAQATPIQAPAPDATPQAQPAIAPPGSDGETISGAPPAPSMPPAPSAGVTGGVAGSAPVPPVGPNGPMSSVAQIAPVVPDESSRHGFSYHYGFDDDDRFVIVSGKTDSFTMSGTGQDARHVEKLRKNIQGDFIWFQRDEKSYVIRDQATIDRAKKLWAPQEELGKKQEALGKQQEALGKQQQELGAKMQQIRVNIPDMTAELEKLKAELQQLSSGATVEQVGHLQSEIGELQSKIGNVQSHAGDQQGKIGEEMGALGAQQGKLGQQQGELGRQQGELSREASRQMKQLLDEALAKRLAQPEL
jgi:chaperonin cofactor prefoldin